MKKIIFIALFIVIGINTVISQNDTINIDIDLSDFGDNIKSKQKDTAISTKTTNKFDFLKQTATIIKAGKKSHLGLMINDKLWISTKYAETIEELGEDYKVKLKGIDDEESLKKIVTLSIQDNSPLSYINNIQSEKSITYSNEKDVESATLIIFYTNSDDSPFDDDAVKIESRNEKITWEKGKGKLKTKIRTKGRRILGGMLIKKYMLSDYKDLNCNSSNKKKKRNSKKSNAKSNFPVGVFQYKNCGVLMKENEDFVIRNIPEKIKSTKKKEKDNDKKVDKKKKKKKGRRRGRGRRGR